MTKEEFPEHLVELLNFEFKEKPVYGYKQYILIRTDDKFSVGKLMVHAAHNACSAIMFEFQKKDGDWADEKLERIRKWFNSGKCQAKIVVKVPSEASLISWIGRVYAYNADIPLAIIPDGGAHEVEPNCIIGCAIGPVSPKEADVLGLSGLKLY